MQSSFLLEFEYAVDLLHQKVANNALEDLGLTQENLINALIISVGFLILL